MNLLGREYRKLTTESQMKRGPVRRRVLSENRSPRRVSLHGRIDEYGIADQDRARREHEAHDAATMLGRANET